MWIRMHRQNGKIFNSSREPGEAVSLQINWSFSSLLHCGTGLAFRQNSAVSYKTGPLRRHSRTCDRIWQACSSYVYSVVATAIHSNSGSSWSIIPVKQLHTVVFCQWYKSSCLSSGETSFCCHVTILVFQLVSAHVYSTSASPRLKGSRLQCKPYSESCGNLMHFMHDRYFIVPYITKC